MGSLDGSVDYRAGSRQDGMLTDRIRDACGGRPLQMPKRLSAKRRTC